MANLTINLAQLQDKIKRDSAGYKDEFETQFHRYKTGLELFQMYPDSDCDQLVELINFIASGRQTQQKNHIKPAVFSFTLL